MPAGRQRADVPDDGTLGIEIGGADHQQTALLVFARDGVEHLLVGVALDHLRERRGVGHGIVEHGGEQATGTKDLVRGHGRVDLAQGGVVVGPEEGEGRNQGAGADAGHYLEFGPRPGFGPAVHQAGAERAVVAATGHGEVAHRRQPHHLSGARRAGGPERGFLAIEGARGFLDQGPGVTVGEEARVGDTERLGACGVGLRHRRPTFGERTTAHADDGGKQRREHCQLVCDQDGLLRGQWRYCRQHACGARLIVRI